MISHPQGMSAARLLPLLGLAAVAAIALALAIGSGATGPGDLVNVLKGSADESTRDVILKLRLPRTLAAFGTGAALALAGVLMQVLLRNPLADPYILGTSGGAAVAALLAMLGGFTALLVDVAAFAGALISTVMVFVMARLRGQWSPGRLLLTGVVVAAGWGAVISLIIATSPEANLRGILFWLMGDFAFSGSPTSILVTTAAASIVAIGLARSLNVLSTGDEQAQSLGLSVRPIRIVVYLLSALLTAIAVTTAGTVGFIGLVVPHLVRLTGNSDHRLLIPGAALAGGTLLVVADLLARTVIAPKQLPVGAITAIIGVPLFLFLLGRLSPSRDQVDRR